MNFKKILALGLSLVLVAGSLPSCGGKKEETKITNVFKETELKLPEKYSGGDNFNLGQVYAAGEIMYALCNEYDPKTYESRQFFLPINLDGSTGAEITIEREEPGDGQSGMYFNNAAFGADGSLWATFSCYSYTENEYRNWAVLRHYKDVNSGEYETIDLSSLNDEETGDEFYINTMVAADDGSLVLQSYNGIKVLGPDGKIKDFDTGDYESIDTVKKFGDKIYFSSYKYDETTGTGGSTYVEMDLTTGKTGKEYPVPSRMSYSLIEGLGGYDYYYNDQNAIWAGNLGSEDKVEILNFINSDINANNMNTIIPLSADKFFATAYDDDYYTQYCMILDRVPDEQVAAKEIIKLATPRLDYDLRSDVIKFNKSSDKYRIVVSDYSIYATDDDYNAGATRLAADLTSGKLPDILQITDAIPYTSYVSKKIFTDLYALMDADTTFDRSLYFENIFKACETNGKLYSLVPRFRLLTFAAKTENLDGITRWNIQEFMNFVKKHPEMQIFDYDFNRSNFLSYVLQFARDNFVDRATGECRFDSEDFKTILEFANSLTTDDFWSNIDYNEVGDEFWQEYDSRFTDNRVLLSQTYFYNLGNSYKSLINYTFKADVTLVGFPSEEGNGAGIEPSFELAILEKSKHKEGSWEFLKSFISEDKQMPTETRWGSYNYGSGIPILKKAVEKQLEIAMTPPENNNDVIVDGGGIAMPMYAETETVASVSMAAPNEGDASEQSLLPGGIAIDVGGVVIGGDSAAVDPAETDAPSDDGTGDGIDADGDGVIDGDNTGDNTGDGDVTIDDPIVDPVEPVYPTNRNTVLTKEQCDALRSMISGATQIIRSDTKLEAIITEEAESYFSGQKSLETVVSIIQNRAETYIAESR